MTYDISDFQTQVLQRSFTIPVLVDFWAEWCGPCRILGPVLERLAGKANGRWELAKVNTEELPEAAAQYGIRSIPNVKLFIDGKVASEFVGALPEPQIEQWLARAIPGKHHATIGQAEALLQTGETVQARALLEVVLQEEPESDQANALMIRALGFSDPMRSLALAERISGIEYGEVVEAARTLGHLAEYRHEAGPQDSSSAAASFQSAIDALFAGNAEDALQMFIDTMRADRKLDDDGARRACIAVFKLLGEEHEVTQKYRREFSSALY